MSRTPSIMVELGTSMPPFTLMDACSDQVLNEKKFDSFLALTVMFICNHCPYVKHVNEQLVKLAAAYIPRGIGFVAISSNDAIQYPDDNFEQMKLMANRLQYPFPYLYDESQQVARDFDAACTPDFFVFDRNRKLVYRGQLDDSRPTNGIPADGRDLRSAFDNLIQGRPVNPIQKPSIGCNIKWKI